jgi:two-component system phosphate regulon response regulator PhoB
MKMNRIIILAQPNELFEFVGHALKREGYQVRLLAEPEPSVSSISKSRPDVLIVDAENSLSTAEDYCLRLRYCLTLQGLRILIVRPESEPATDSVSTLGHDAYVDRPLHPESLIARVRALLETKGVAHPTDEIVVRDLVIDPNSFRVTRGGSVLSLTLSEFRLLYYMAAHPHVVCRRDRLLNVVWGNSDVNPRTVDVFVRRLRQKIEASSGKSVGNWRAQR